LRIELNITVLCTFHYLFQMRFYKYYAALPLIITVFNALNYKMYCRYYQKKVRSTEIFVAEKFIMKDKGAEHRNIQKVPFIS
jgi:hypothetical protein